MRVALPLVLALGLGLGLDPARAAGPRPLPDAATLAKSNARYAPIDISVDLGGLPESERRALAELVRAAQVLDGIYLRQVWAGNPALLMELGGDPSPFGRERLRAFLLNTGPWTDLDEDAPFLPGVPPKPESANFYPPDATKAEIEQWMASLPEAEQRAARGFFTVIRRGPDKKLQAVPYSVEYQGELGLAAEHLVRAARLTRESTLAAFLDQRAAALLSNEYYDSDVAWMKLESAIEPTFGPYEVYDDRWLNAKAAFEAYITVRDAAATERLQRFSAELQDIENHLPMDPAMRNPKLGALTPIRVVNVVFNAGQGNAGVQSAAYNLPNDERITKEQGTKRVMLKNMQEAKFERVLLPIAKVALGRADAGEVSFDAFFTHILMHELVHGLGPHNITARGQATTVRAELAEFYSPIEEAKADVAGLFALQHLIDKGVVDKGLERSLYPTYLASAFRSIRFGTNEAHGKGTALQLNYLLDAGAVRVAADGSFSVDRGKVKGALARLARELLTIEGRGDKARARALLERLGVVRPEARRVLERLADVPVDIAPRFLTAAALVAETR